MSLAFSDTTNKDGILQHIEDYCDFDDGYITGNTTRLKKWTGRVNLALDYIWGVIFSVGGMWQFDDSNHTDYPIITTDLTSGQRDYAFTSDENGNIILDIYKVLIAQPDGTFVEIKPTDVQSSDEPSFYDGNNTTGTPTKYDKTGNGIFLNFIPNYTISGGIKIYINREGSYFSTSDTTKKAGFAGIYHELLALIPSYKFGSLHLADRVVNRIEGLIIKLENGLKDYYGKREKDVARRMTPKVHSTR